MTAKKLYRCQNCGKTFEADRPACVDCKIDPADNPRFASLITPLVTVHFDPPTHVRSIGQNKAACDGKPFNGRAATGEPSAVNCAKCRATDVWKLADSGEPAFHAEHDELVTVAGGVVKTGEEAAAAVSGGGQAPTSGASVSMKSPGACC